MARPKKAEAARPSTTKELQDLLWASADKLRGSMDASQYKDVVLGLVFLKYVSDAFDERLEVEGDYEGCRGGRAEPVGGQVLEDLQERQAPLVGVLVLGERRIGGVVAAKVCPPRRAGKSPRAKTHRW